MSKRKRHPLIGELVDDEPVVVVAPEPDPPEPAKLRGASMFERRYAEDVEEVVIEAPRVPERPSTRRILRNVVVAALRRVADKLDRP